MTIITLEERQRQARLYIDMVLDDRYDRTVYQAVQREFGEAPDLYDLPVQDAVKSAFTKFILEATRSLAEQGLDVPDQHGRLMACMMQGFVAGAAYERAHPTALNSRKE